MLVSENPIQNLYWVGVERRLDRGINREWQLGGAPFPGEFPLHNFFFNDVVPGPPLREKVWTP